MNTIVYIALSILFFGCTFACGYCCAMEADARRAIPADRRFGEEG